uniref:TPR_REGION domain-containing protein n=1 Tax=Heterorhabditis bacteriophora TaxID=37862 RepID=A0A1I7WFV4_HETBA
MKNSSRNNKLCPAQQRLPFIVLLLFNISPDLFLFFRRIKASRSIPKLSKKFSCLRALGSLLIDVRKYVDVAIQLPENTEGAHRYATECMLEYKKYSTAMTSLSEIFKQKGELKLKTWRDSCPQARSEKQWSTHDLIQVLTALTRNGQNNARNQIQFKIERTQPLIVEAKTSEFMGQQSTKTNSQQLQSSPKRKLSTKPIPTNRFETATLAPKDMNLVTQASNTDIKNQPVGTFNTRRFKTRLRLLHFTKVKCQAFLSLHPLSNESGRHRNKRLFSWCSHPREKRPIKDIDKSIFPIGKFSAYVPLSSVLLPLIFFRLSVHLYLAYCALCKLGAVSYKFHRINIDSHYHYDKLASETKHRSSSGEHSPNVPHHNTDHNTTEGHPKKCQDIKSGTSDKQWMTHSGRNSYLTGPQSNQKDLFLEMQRQKEIPWMAKHSMEKIDGLITVRELFEKRIEKPNMTTVSANCTIMHIEGMISLLLFFRSFSVTTLIISRYIVDCLLLYIKVLLPKFEIVLNYTTVPHG